MKLGKYILGLALVAVGLTSCDKDNVGAIYDGPAMANISFVRNAINAETEDESIIVPVVLTRTYSTEAYRTTVTISNATPDISLLSNEVVFPAGVEYDTLYVEATNLDWGDLDSCKLNLTEADINTANKFDKPNHVVTIKIKKPRLIPAGTCTFTDYTWGDADGNPVTAYDVPIINVEGSDRYRIISPLYYAYKDIEDGADMSNFEFHLLEDGGAKVDNGTPLNFWGYLAYFDSTNYGGYCFVGNDGNTYDVNFLLLSGSNLYTGGHFVFVWDKPAQD
jgi:hypothetical protein